MSTFRIIPAEGEPRETTDKDEFETLVRLLTDSERDFETEVENVAGE